MAPSLWGAGKISIKCGVTRVTSVTSVDKPLNLKGKITDTRGRCDLCKRCNEAERCNALGIGRELDNTA